MSDQPGVPPFAPRSGWFGLSNPIQVIGAFLAVIEVAIIAATVFVDGYLQWLMALFALGYAVWMSRRFFRIQAENPVSFFGPQDFGGETTIESYAVWTAMSESLRSSPAMRETFRQELASQLGGSAELRRSIEQIIPADAPSEEREQVRRDILQSVSEAAGRAVEKVTDRPSLTLSSEVPGEASLRWRLPHMPNMPVSALIDYVSTIRVAYQNIQPPSTPQEIMSFTRFLYGSSWVLVDRESGRRFNAIGTQWAAHRRLTSDDRSIEDVGILAGMHVVIRQGTPEDLAEAKAPGDNL